MVFRNDSELYQLIGANIKCHRERANLTQSQLADAAKISISYLSKIEASG
ncbi:MAG: helix-turn-helix domain-containing protein [Anaerovoracaceae bacterium]